MYGLINWLSIVQHEFRQKKTPAVSLHRMNCKIPYSNLQTWFKHHSNRDIHSDLLEPFIARKLTLVSSSKFEYSVLNSMPYNVLLLCFDNQKTNLKSELSQVGSTSQVRSLLQRVQLPTKSLDFRRFGFLLWNYEKQWVNL